MASEDKTPKRWTWKERLIVPTLIAGVAGAGVGLVSKHRRTHGLANISATYATNCSIITACYCGAREFVRETRAAGPDDLISCAMGGFGSGALLGRIQGGQAGAIKYSIMFAIAGTTIDFTTHQLLTHFQRYRESTEKSGWLRLPEWSPIRVLDEEALAAKRAREEELRAQITMPKLDKEKC